MISIHFYFWLRGGRCTLGQQSKCNSISRLWFVPQMFALRPLAKRTLAQGFAFPSQANPADTVIDIITGNGAQYTVGGGRNRTSIGHLINEWSSISRCSDKSRPTSVKSRRTSIQSVHSSTVEQEMNLIRTMKARGATWPAQMCYCFKRSVTQQVRNSTSLTLEIGVGALAGLIIGLAAFTSRGHLFQGVYYPPFTILSSAVDYQSTPQLGLLSAMVSNRMDRRVYSIQNTTWLPRVGSLPLA